MKHQEHIVCIKSNILSPNENGMASYTLSLADLMLGQRKTLENDEDFRQVLPITIFTHKGKIWAYKRTPKGGEARLHDKIAVAVGGHWDIADLIITEGVIDLESSLHAAVSREIEEEVDITSSIVNRYQLKNIICASDTEVDKVHAGFVTIVELDGEGITSSEDQLEAVGFVHPSELLGGDYDLETWARIICEILISE